MVFLLEILTPTCDSSSLAFHMMYSTYKLNKQGDNIQSVVLLPQFGISSLFHMSSSNCCFLTCTQVLQEAGKVVWYSHLFKNFPQFAVIYTVKSFSIVNEAEVDVFLKFSCFFCVPTNDGSLISGSSEFSKST